MKVSVCIITYNHEKFIAQAIDSVLMQQVNFPYEILIGEDQSSDNTRNIVLDYYQKHPESIRLFLHDHPSGFQHVNGRQNFVTNIINAKGQYIALLEGDDYWTSRSKLQKQVDFLDAHPDFAICCHNAQEVYENGEREPWNYCPAGMRENQTIWDVLVWNFMPTCSVVFRRGLFGEFPDWYFQAPFGDWPLNVLNAQHGSIHYIDEVMAVHRNHAGCMWSRRDQVQNIEDVIRFYPILEGYLGPQYRRLIQKEVCRLYFDMAKIYRERGEYAKARRAVLAGTRTKPLNSHILSWDVFHTFAQAVFHS